MEHEATSGVSRRAAIGMGAGMVAGLAAVGSMGGVAMGQPAMPAPRRIGDGKPLTLDLGGFDADKGEYVLPALPYDAKDLEPHIDKETMAVHHGKHHQGYVTGANRALRELADIRDGGDAGLVKHWARELSFHLGGHINHCLFWKMVAPAGKGAKKGGGGEPSGALADAIKRDFGAYEKFVAHFKANAIQVESNGWGWLVVEPMSKRLMLVQMQSQQERLFAGAMPVLGIDVWEHAYYLKHQNKRNEYVDAFFQVINWEYCGMLYEQATRA